MRRGLQSPPSSGPGSLLQLTEGQATGRDQSPQEASGWVRRPWRSPQPSGEVECHHHVDDPAGGHKDAEEQAEEHE